MSNTVEMQVVHPHAAGIDVGSRSHWVAVGQGADQVKEFGVYHQDLEDLVFFLKSHQIRTVALESTGSYWQNLYSLLDASGFETCLCNGKFTKHIKGRKTDIQDCQWIQKLHMLGLLNHSFLPEEKTEVLRTYCRHRDTLIKSAARSSNKMQKYLRLLNLRLDVVVRDICGATGMKIIRAICQGETDGKKLASFRDKRCKKSEEEIAKALKGNGRKDYLFTLKQELDTYDFYQDKIKQCDLEIGEQLDYIIVDDENKKQHLPPKGKRKHNKNDPKNLHIQNLSYQMFEGVDLSQIEGVSTATLLTLMSELGIEGISKFETAKQFTSWLRLAPNNKVSGGKLLSSRIPKGSNRVKIALRNAANVIGNQKKSTPLKDFFAKISFRKGRAAAISATARKLAVIIWNMVTKGVPYNRIKLHVDEDKQRNSVIKRIKNQMKNYSITIDMVQIEDNPPLTTC